MYRRPKFLEILIEIRQEMSRSADYDMDLFAEMIRSGKFPDNRHSFNSDESRDRNETNDDAADSESVM